MTISSLQITNFRNILTAKLAPVIGLNIITGENGSGKTSLLEAIYFLSIGRSFRCANPARLICHDHPKFSLFAQIFNADRLMPLGIERDRGGQMRMRMSNKEVNTLSELVSLLPIRLINAQSHQLFESGPLYRRKYLDWGAFYDQPTFFECWRNFERVLKQRNAVLRDRRSKQELDVWTEELIHYGLLLNQMRCDYVTALVPYVARAAETLLNVEKITLAYYPGWAEHTAYASILKSAYNNEFRLGFTQFGPHRADLNVEIGGQPAKHYLSRGQQKLLICAMMIAQGMLLTKQANKDPIYLIDDLPSELDALSKDRLISLLSAQSSQVFITAIESDFVLGLKEQISKPLNMFHVEQGQIKLMAKEKWVGSELNLNPLSSVL